MNIIHMRDDTYMQNVLCGTNNKTVYIKNSTTKH